jgi:alpha-amylase/alpha-mannosidase (GH57 family)
VWNNHQPLYPVVDGAASRPWVRAHATKDYVDMAEQAAASGVPVTFNMSGVLLTQLEAMAKGQKDVYRVIAEVPAEGLTPTERDFVTSRFFDTNEKIVGRFPRYQQLANADRKAFSVNDLRDLQVLWNLAWFDPRFLAVEPLRALVDKGNDYSEADKVTLFAEVDRVVASVIPTYAKLWKEGKIDVITTPLAHPILPLVVDSDLFRETDPQGIGPQDRFREYLDGKEQVDRGLAVAERLLGQRPTGMWPGEGSVAQDVVKLFSDASVQWVASGEDTLAHSMAAGSFERDASGTVRRGDDLYRPYAARHDADSKPVNLVFRDTSLSDHIGFEYSGQGADQAADDFIGRLQTISASLADKPGAHLVTVLLDGENSWEHYANDGIDFLDAMYKRLGHTDGIVPITPTKFLKEHPEASKPLARLAPGSWIGGNFTTWIGEAEEAAAWDELRTTRLALRDAQQTGKVPQAQLEAAMEQMLWAEGSDWFWWYGNDQDSGNDDYFDGAYRELLGRVYDAIGVKRPEWVAVPLVTTAPEPATAKGDIAGPAGTLNVAFDLKGKVLLLDGVSGTYEVYLGSPRSSKKGRGTSLDGKVLGFAATQAVRVDVASGSACLYASLPPVGNTTITPVCEPLEWRPTVGAKIPLTALGGLQQGDKLFVRIVNRLGMSPAKAPGAVVTPDVGGVDVIFSMVDPKSDDHGPGSTTYPTDSVFAPGSFDLTKFSWGVAEGEVVFTFDLGGPVRNPWGSPNGLALQTFDVYIDADPGKATGESDLLAGRGAHLAAGNGWDAAVVFEGWAAKVVRAMPQGRMEDHPTMSIVVLAEEGRVIGRVALAALGLTSDPKTWKLAVTVASQDGYPSAGVDRIRDVDSTARQWRLGGGASTRIVDTLNPEVGRQEQLLSKPTPEVAMLGKP